MLGAGCPVVGTRYCASTGKIQCRKAKAPTHVRPHEIHQPQHQQKQNKIKAAGLVSRPRIVSAKEKATMARSKRRRGGKGGKIMSAKAKAKAEAAAAAEAAAKGESTDSGAGAKGVGVLGKVAGGKAGAEDESEDEMSETRRALQAVGVYVSEEDDVLKHCSVAGTLASRPEMRDIHVTDFTASIFGRKL